MSIKQIIIVRLTPLYLRVSQCVNLIFVQLLGGVAICHKVSYPFKAHVPVQPLALFHAYFLYCRTCYSLFYDRYVKPKFVRGRFFLNMSWKIYFLTWRHSLLNVSSYIRTVWTVASFLIPQITGVPKRDKIKNHACRLRQWSHCKKLESLA